MEIESISCIIFCPNNILHDVVVLHVRFIDQFTMGVSFQIQYRSILVALENYLH